MRRFHIDTLPDNRQEALELTFFMATRDKQPARHPDDETAWRHVAAGLAYLFMPYVGGKPSFNEWLDRHPEWKTDG